MQTPRDMGLVRCVRLGELLLDENKKLFILCSKCRSDFTTMTTYQEHLNECNDLKQFSISNAIPAFPEDIEKKYKRKIGEGANNMPKAYLLNEIKDVNVHLIEPEKSFCESNLHTKAASPKLCTREEKPINQINGKYMHDEAEFRWKQENNSINKSNISRGVLKHAVITYDVTNDKQLASSNKNSTTITETQMRSLRTLKRSATTPITEDKALLPIKRVITQPDITKTILPVQTQLEIQTKEMITKLNSLGITVTRKKTENSENNVQNQETIICDSETLKLIERLQSKGIKLNIVKENNKTKVFICDVEISPIKHKTAEYL